MKHNMITTFLFDLGGVLFTNGTKQFITELAKRYSLSEESVKNIIDGDLGTQYREGGITRDEFWTKVKVKLAISESVGSLEKQWIQGYEIIYETKNCIKELSAKYNVFYLSDNVKERVEALDRRFQFISLFKGGVFSHEVGVRKPDPKIYTFALSKAHALPSETVFIDDKESNLDPAKKMGITPLLFTTPEQLRRDIEKYL